MPVKLLADTCRRFTKFNTCVGGNWLDCFSKETIVRIVNEVFSEMGKLIPFVSEWKITIADVEELNDFVIGLSICHPFIGLFNLYST